MANPLDSKLEKKLAEIVERALTTRVGGIDYCRFATESDVRAAVREAVDAALEELVPFAFHRSGCSVSPNGGCWRKFDERLCNCGLAAALRREKNHV